MLQWVLLLFSLLPLLLPLLPLLLLLSFWKQDDMPFVPTHNSHSELTTRSDMLNVAFCLILPYTSIPIPLFRLVLMDGSYLSFVYRVYPRVSYFVVNTPPMSHSLTWRIWHAYSLRAPSLAHSNGGKMRFHYTPSIVLLSLAHLPRVISWGWELFLWCS